VDARAHKGTCAGIAQALAHVPQNHPFMLTWCDLILPNELELPASINDNFIGLSRDFPCRWRLDEQNNKMLEQQSNNDGIAGLFIFKNVAEIQDVPQDGEFVRYLASRTNAFQAINLTKGDKQIEYGLLSVYEDTQKKESGRCRPFNSMKIQDNVITKRGIDDQGRNLAVREVAWYRKATELGFTDMPAIHEYEPLVMDKVHGKNIFLYHDLTLDQKKEILSNLIDTLNHLHSLASAPTNDFSTLDAYITKTLKRIDKVRDLIPFANQRKIKINNKDYRNIFFYREQFKSMLNSLTTQEFKFIHGDCTFSNMMLDEDNDLKPVLIDPRGYFGHTELYGDVNYDWAKVYYSLAGNYDQFNLGNFKLQIGKTEVKLHIDSNGWEDLSDYFFELLPNVNRGTIELLHAIIWLSLTTYAWEDYDSICGAFYNGLMYLDKFLSD
jgi:hypothetical protein